MKMDMLQRVDYITSIKPTASLAATLTGETIDRLDYMSALMNAYVGVLTGTPDTVSAVFTICHGSASNMSDEAVLSNVTFTIAAASTASKLYLNLINAKRYIRIKCVLTFTGGTTPTASITAGCVLGDPTKAKVNNYSVYDLGNNKKMADGNW
jgi:hypothetical protein